MTNTQSSFFESWFIGEDRRHLMGVLFFILVVVLHLGAKAGFLNLPPIEPPKLKIVEIELLAPPPPPVAPPAPITPPTPTPPKPVPPKPKPVPPKPKPVPKPKPKPVEMPKPDDFLIPEPTPIKAPPVPYTPPAPPRPAAPASSKPSTNAAPVAHGNQRPTCLRCPHPHYPELARRRNWQGTVKLKIFVDSDGDVKNVDVISSSGYDALDEAAVDDVKGWRFAEGDAGTIRVATQSINFKLDD